jgi:hypothetical protein
VLDKDTETVVVAEATIVPVAELLRLSVALADALFDAEAQPEDVEEKSKPAVVLPAAVRECTEEALLDTQGDALDDKLVVTEELHDEEPENVPDMVVEEEMLLIEDNESVAEEVKEERRDGEDKGLRLSSVPLAGAEKQAVFECEPEGLEVWVLEGEELVQLDMEDDWEARSELERVIVEERVRLATGLLVTLPLNEKREDELPEARVEKEDTTDKLALPDIVADVVLLVLELGLAEEEGETNTGIPLELTLEQTEGVGLLQPEKEADIEGRALADASPLELTSTLKVKLPVCVVGGERVATKLDGTLEALEDTVTVSVPDARAEEEKDAVTDGVSEEEGITEKVPT